MAIVHNVGTTIQNRLQVTLGGSAVTPASGSSLDAAGSSGTLVIGTNTLSGTTGVLVSITLQAPSFSYASGVGSATATLLGVPLSGNAVATGTAAKAEFRDKNGVTIISGLTVGTSGSDINLNSVSVNSGQSVTITSAVITGS